MKKFTSIITLMLIAAMAFTFTSCEDEYIADNLSGGTFYGKTWQGTIRQYYHDPERHGREPFVSTTTIVGVSPETTTAP